MKIQNYQQFYNLIKSDNLPIKQSLLECITSVIKACNCERELKQKRSNTCNDLYINWVKNNASNYIEYWKHKTNDSFISFFHSQTYEILTIKLNDL